MTANITRIYLIISHILNNGNFLCLYNCLFSRMVARF